MSNIGQLYTVYPHQHLDDVTNIIMANVETYSYMYNVNPHQQTMRFK